MSDVKRYEMSDYDGLRECRPGTKPAEGDMVAWEDYAALRAQVAGLTKSLEQLLFIVVDCDALGVYQHECDTARKALAEAGG